MNARCLQERIEEVHRFLFVCIYIICHEDLLCCLFCIVIILRVIERDNVIKYIIIIRTAVSMKNVDVSFSTLQPVLNQCISLCI